MNPPPPISRWTRLWVYTRLATFALITLYAGLLLLLNRNAVVAPRLTLVFAAWESPGAVVVLLCTAGVSVVATLLATVAYRTLRQLSDIRRSDRQNAARLDESHGPQRMSDPSVGELVKPPAADADTNAGVTGEPPDDARGRGAAGM